MAVRVIPYSCLQGFLKFALIKFLHSFRLRGYNISHYYAIREKKSKNESSWVSRWSFIVLYRKKKSKKNNPEKLYEGKTF